MLDVLDHHDQPLIAAHLATVIQCLDTQPGNAPRPPATDDANVSLPPLMEPGSFNAANPLIAKLSRVMTLNRGVIAQERVPGPRWRTDRIRSANLVPQRLELLRDHLTP
ncbi:MAG: hypothetical protein EOO38_00950 [Cytophagaceae bacterium]|nr:MAG: hypothetical protein EOO38_00950 [Cytophagaceae bacterium]